MNEPITKPVMVCQECYDLNCSIHDDLKREVQCLICEATHESLTQALNCCYPMTDKSVVGDTGYAKERKKAGWAVKPDNESVFGKDKAVLHKALN